MTQLYLVGTNHLDLKGPKRLEKILGLVSPDIIGLESTIENYKKRLEDHNGFELEKPLFNMILSRQYGEEVTKNITSYLSMLGYESWLPSEYVKQTEGVDIVLFDEYDVELIRPKTKEVFGDLVNDSNEVTPEFIEDIANMNFSTYQESVDRTYDMNSVEEIQKDPELFKALLIDRDEIAEKKIRESFEKTNNDMVYIGGNLHFFGDYDNLYEGLKDLNPVRVKLSEVDKF